MFLIDRQHISNANVRQGLLKHPTNHVTLGLAPAAVCEWLYPTTSSTLLVDSLVGLQTLCSSASLARQRSDCPLQKALAGPRHRQRTPAQFTFARLRILDLYFKQKFKFRNHCSGSLSSRFFVQSLVLLVVLRSKWSLPGFGPMELRGVLIHELGATTTSSRGCSVSSAKLANAACHKRIYYTVLQTVPPYAPEESS